MLYLCFLTLTFMASITQAAVTIEQSQISVTVPGDRRSTVDITCRILEYSYFNIHWYVQKRNGELKRILFMSEYDDDTVYDTGATQDKFLTARNSNKLTIKKLSDEDAGIYYCAHWYNYYYISYYRKNFAEGTQVIISNQTVKGPEVAILKSSIEDVIREGFAIYMCSLQNFFPGVIRVVWKEVDSGKDVESEQDMIEHNTDSNTYSLNSWIKVMNSDLGKVFTCKYKHEKNGDGWKNKFVSGFEYLQGNPYLNHMTYRAAQITYAVLLLKSIIYCPLLIFLKSKVKP